MSEDIIREIDQCFSSDQNSSLRSVSNQVNVSSSVRNVARNILKLFPYKIQTGHQLNERDCESRINFCSWMLNQINNDEEFLDNCFFSDEAHFYLSGYVNRQNYRFWAKENPSVSHRRPLHSAKVTAFVIMSRSLIFGPYWFSGTINQRTYVDILKDQFYPECLEKGLDMTKMWWKQDGATPHASNYALEWLKEKFGEKIISRRTDHVWPSNSPDLSPLDFYLWGKIKDNVYKTRPQSLTHLQEKIIAEVASIEGDELERVFSNFEDRLKQCIDQKGSYLSNLFVL